MVIFCMVEDTWLRHTVDLKSLPVGVAVGIPPIMGGYRGVFIRIANTTSHTPKMKICLRWTG